MTYWLVYKAWQRRRTLSHIVASSVAPIPVPSRLPSLCGYWPRTSWDIVLSLSAWSTSEPCPECEAIHRRVLAVSA